MADGITPVTTSDVQVDPRSKGWFKPGQSGNPKGRPVSSRHKLDECFVRALYEDFKDNGAAAVRRCREDKPDVYLNVIAKVVPKQVDLNADPAVADLAAGLHAVADFLSSFAAEGSGTDLERAVPGGPLLSAGPRAEEE